MEQLLFPFFVTQRKLLISKFLGWKLGFGKDIHTDINTL